MTLNNDRGLTLVEIIVSIAILGIIVAPLSSLFVNTVRNNSLAKDKMIANQYAQRYMEKIMLEIKGEGPLILGDRSPTSENGFIIETSVEQIGNYVIETSSGTKEVGTPHAVINVANDMEIEIKNGEIKDIDSNTMLGGYLEEHDSLIAIKMNNNSSPQVFAKIINKSDKEVHIYKHYNEGKEIIIDAVVGEVYSYDNYNPEDSGVDEKKNNLCKITVMVKKDGKDLAKLVSYKTND